MIRAAALLIALALPAGAQEPAPYQGAARVPGYAGGPSPIDPGDCPAGPAGADWAQRALVRATSPALGLPPMPHPPDNGPTAAKIELGRKIFFDRRLSINGTMSCAMCHVPEQAFANWELQTAIGVEGRSVRRNAPSLMNVGYLEVLFHDGRDFSLETQFIGPLVADNEMANPSAGHAVQQMRGFADYAPLFEMAFGRPPDLAGIGQALGAYQRSLIAADSPFDRWRFGGQADAMTASAQRGFALFDGAAGCSGCHLIGPEDALLTDQQFHDTGYLRMREDERQNPPDSAPVQAAPGVVFQVPFHLIRSVSAPPPADLGRYEVTEDPADRWLIRTPPLRNVAATPPYMHDGGFGTLAEVIDFYDRGGAGLAGQDARIRPLGLSDGDKADLLAFLSALTSPDIPCLTDEARKAAPDNVTDRSRALR